MTQVLTAIFDNKAECFFAPSKCRSSADFIRQVQIEAKKKDSMFNQFPKDYELYVMAQWDEKEGIIGTDLTRLGSVYDLCPLE